MLCSKKRKTRKISLLLLAVFVACEVFLNFQLIGKTFLPTDSETATAAAEGSHVRSFLDGSGEPPLADDTRWIVNHNLRDKIFRPLTSGSPLPPKNTTIRKWGCHRTESPLLFVHIGKTAGGMVRARLAAAAVDYSRTDEEWKHPELDNHYYPIYESTGNNFNTTKIVAKAKFCNSRASNHRHPNSSLYSKTFEGNVFCNATTPMGMAFACPESKPPGAWCKSCNVRESQECYLVYVGHNNLGNELHWLPPRFLENWWKTTPWASNLTLPWTTLLPRDRRWCRKQSLPRPKTQTEMMNKHYWKCGLPLASAMDHTFTTFWSETTSTTTTPSSSGSFLDFSSIYASLPVQRITVMREPWSWLVSKFFWHRRHKTSIKCDDVDTATRTRFPKVGWAIEDALRYILNLCGDDCVARLEHGMMSLEELERQSEHNLRHSFSVVGLLDEMDSFYEMVDQRIAYVDLRLNPNVTGPVHPSARTSESQRCKDVFADETFRATMREAAPILAVLERLYHVGVEVSHHQKQELKQCVSKQSL